MDSRNNSLLKLSQKGTIDKSQDLILRLYSVVKDCPVCQNKLKEKKMAEGYHPSTPTGHKMVDDDAQPPACNKEMISSHYD